MLRVVLVAASLTFLSASPGIAAGALAIGEPADIAKQGYASGVGYNHKTQSEADERALKECRSNADASATAKKLCKIVRTFADQCAAVAIDPIDATPGAGWGVGDTLALASSAAMERCRATAGARADQCMVTVEVCDGKAK
jgi:hypothetical protein